MLAVVHEANLGLLVSVITTRLKYRVITPFRAAVSSSLLLSRNCSSADAFRSLFLPWPVLLVPSLVFPTSTIPSFGSIAKLTNLRKYLFL